jgi:hypothetical protein
MDDEAGPPTGGGFPVSRGIRLRLLPRIGPARARRRGRLIRGHDELDVGLAAHAVDGTGPAGSCGVLVAAGFFGHHGDGAVGAADDRSGRIEWRCGAEVDDESYVFAGALPLDRGSRFDAEEGVAFGVGDAGSD